MTASAARIAARAARPFHPAASGSALTWLSIVDEYTRECLTFKAPRSITSEVVIDSLAELFAMRGVPAHIRSDNGSIFIFWSLLPVAPITRAGR